MSNLQSALGAVKEGMIFEESENQVEAAIAAYENAVAHFSEAVRCNELKNQQFQQEIDAQLNFYAEKVEKLKYESSKKTEKVPEEDAELLKRIEATVIIETPNTRLQDVAGLDDVKHALRQAVVLPIKHPELFGENFSPYNGFLLFGPPGTGKSHLARAVAGEAIGTTFFALSASDLISKYQGESENLIKNLFKAARRMKPSIIFIDEVDSLAMSRSDSDQDGSRRIKTELFVQMQGANVNNSGVFVMAATNTPHNLDDAFLRRFDKLLYIPLPEKEARYQLFQMELKISSGITDETLLEAASKSDGLSGSDIAIVTRKAKMEAVTRLEQSTHFQKVNKSGKTFWKPCKKNTTGAVQMSFDDLPPNSLEYTADPTKEDIMRCVSQARSRTDKSQLRRLEQFAEEKGEGFRRVEAGGEKIKVSKTRKVFEFLLNFL